MTELRQIETDCEVPVRVAQNSLWPELFWIGEWAQLRTSLVYEGLGIPHGSGEPVIVVPGFLGSDQHTAEMRGWLDRIGYSPHESGIGHNIDCPDISLERLEETVASVVERSGRATRIVGHSLGGMLARSVAVRRPSLVRQVITLGSPLRVISAHPLVLWVARLLRDVTPAPDRSPRRHGDHMHDGTCACELMDSLARPFPEVVDRTSVYSRRDGIVDWQACVDAAPGQNVEVSTSHLGMLVNKNVYRAVAEALAAPEVVAPMEEAA